MSRAVWGHLRQTGHGGEFWQNVVHWRRERQTTSVFLPWEPHEQCEKTPSPSCLQFPSHAVQPLSPALLLWLFLLKCSAQPTWPGKFSSGVSSHPPFTFQGGLVQGSLSTLHAALLCFLSSPPCNSELFKGRACLVCLCDSWHRVGAGWGCSQCPLPSAIPGSSTIKGIVPQGRAFLAEWGHPEPHQQRWGVPRTVLGSASLTEGRVCFSGVQESHAKWRLLWCAQVCPG